MRIVPELIELNVMAQTAPAFGNQAAALAIGCLVVLLLMAVGCVVLWLVSRSFRYSRQLLHAERMKSLERDGTWGDPNQNGPVKSYVTGSFWLSFWLVLFGCVTPFFAIAMVGGFRDSQAIATPIVAWSAASAASIAAAVCATVIMGNTRRALSDDRPPSSDAADNP